MPPAFSIDHATQWFHPCLQPPFFLEPHVDCTNIRMLLEGIRHREGNPLIDAEQLLQLGESLIDAGLVLVTKEETFEQMENFFLYLSMENPSDFCEDSEKTGDLSIVLSRDNRLYLEDFCASSMIKKQLKLLTENKFKREKLNSLYETCKEHTLTATTSTEDYFEPFALELKDEARKWFKEIPEKSPFVELGWVQPHIKGPLKKFIKEIK